MNSSGGLRPNQDDDQTKGQKSGDIPSEYLGNVLRAEILPADEVTVEKPGWRRIFLRFNNRHVYLLLIVLVVLCSGLVCLVGPGKPFFQQSLGVIKNLSLIPTLTNTAKIEPAKIEATQVRPSITIVLTETSTAIPPSRTPTLLPTLTPTEEDGCVDALDVQLDDVGKTMCVRGIIIGMEEREVGFIVNFSDDRGIFYLVTYDFIWDQAEPGDCIQITGEIQQLSNTPVLVFGWSNIPEFCP